jgi:stage 0 sporulation protein B (sporulation initiation phosphotransferase)
MNRKEDFIHYLKHYRHDWLNHIQIIKGYLSLEKIEQAQKFLDQVIVDTHYESKISQLGDTDLSYFLLTFNWRQDKVVLDIEFEEDHVEISKIGANYPYLLAWITNITQSVEEICDCHQENRLSFLFHVIEHKLIMTVEYTGSWEEQEGRKAIQELTRIVESDQGSLKVEIHTSTEFSFEIVAKAL